MLRLFVQRINNKATQINKQANLPSSFGKNDQNNIFVMPKQHGCAHLHDHGCPAATHGRVRVQWLSGQHFSNALK